MEDAEKSRFLRDVSAANQVVVRGVATDSGYGAASNLSIAFARLSAIICGSYLAWHGQITLGTVIAFLGYVGGLFGPVQGSAGSIPAFARLRSRWTRSSAFSMSRSISAILLTRPILPM